MIALDTTAIIDLFKGNEQIRTVLKKEQGPFVSTEINYLELLFGLDPANKAHQKEMEYYNQLFDEIRLLGLHRESCARSSQVFWMLRKDGFTIGQFDCIIAGILLTYGVQKIVTRNAKLKPLKGMKVISY